MPTPARLFYVTVEHLNHAGDPWINGTVKSITYSPCFLSRDMAVAWLFDNYKLLGLPDKSTHGYAYEPKYVREFLSDNDAACWGSPIPGPHSWKVEVKRFTPGVFMEPAPQRITPHNGWHDEDPEPPF